MNETGELFTHTGTTMGTGYSAVFSLPPACDERSVATGIHAAVSRVDWQMSNWKLDSPLSQFNCAPVGAWVSVPPRDLALVVHEGLRLSRLTAGAFDMTLGGLVGLWGFGPLGMRGETPDEAAIRAAVANAGHEKLEARRDPPALRKSAGFELDLSGIAKARTEDSRR